MLMSYYTTDFHVHEPNAVALEDSIMQRGVKTTAGSSMLEYFTSPFDAAVVERLNEANVTISGRSCMPEFGIPNVLSDGLEKPSGSIEALAKGSASFCLCNDLFGQYRRQAAENGMFYIHPSYGSVSRYGLIPLASSMDQIGVLCKNMDDGFSMLSLIAGKDERDGAMLPRSSYSYRKSEGNIRICTPSNVINQMSASAQKALRALSAKFAVKDDDLGFFKVYAQTMYILSCAEISSNLNRYDGVKYGYRSPRADNLESLYIRTRTEALGREAKLTAIMGAYVLSAEQYVPRYEKAMKIRRLIKRSLRFDRYDVLALPTSIGSSPYDNLSLYALTAMAGLPSVSFSYNGIGIQLIANVMNENVLYAAWEVLQA